MKDYLKRGILFIIGVNVLALGIILNTKSNMGVSAINTVPYSLSLIFNISLGSVTTLLYVVFIIIQLLLIRQLDFKILLQFPFSFLFGILIDFYNDIIIISNLNLLIQIILLILGIVITALGASMMIEAKLVLNPADGIVHTIASYLHKEFGLVKNVFDITMILITTCLCLLLKGYLIGIGIGTVCSALFIGRFISLYQRMIFKKKGLDNE